MVGKMILAAFLALTLGATNFAFAGDDKGSAEVIVKGVMQEDKAGMFVNADGQNYDLIFGDDSSANMKRFYSSLEGDMVRVKGKLVVETNKEGKTRLMVLANEVTRLRGERAPEVKIETRVIEERPVYIERRRGIHVPFVDIHF